MVQQYFGHWSSAKMAAVLLGLNVSLISLALYHLAVAHYSIPVSPVHDVWILHWAGFLLTHLAHAARLLAVAGDKNSSVYVQAGEGESQFHFYSLLRKICKFLMALDWSNLAAGVKLASLSHQEGC